MLILAGSSNAGAKSSGLPFSRDLIRALERARAEGKPLVVAFVAEWCPMSIAMKSEVFRDPRLVGMADDFVWALIDIDRHLPLAREHGIEGVPLIKVLDPYGAESDFLLGLWQAEELADRFEALRNGQEVAPAAAQRASSHLSWRTGSYRGTNRVGFSHAGYGPLSVYAQSPFQSLRMGIRPRGPSTLGRGEYEVRATATWSNYWAIDGDMDNPDKRYHLDFETLQNTLSVAYGIADKFEVELELQNRSRFGGVLDSLSQASHDFFGLTQNDRDLVDKGLFVFDLNPPDGSGPVSLDTSSRQSFSRTVQLSLQHNVTAGTSRAPGFSWGVTGRVETANVGDLSGGNEIDLGVSGALSRRFRNVYLYGTLGYAWFGRDRFYSVALRGTQWTLLLAGEWRFNPHMSIVLQWLSTEGLIEDFHPFSRRSDEFVLGYKWELHERGLLELGLVENLVAFDNTPDVGLHFGYSRRF